MLESQQEASFTPNGARPCVNDQGFWSTKPNHPKPPPYPVESVVGMWVPTSSPPVPTLSNQPIVPSNPPCGSYRAAGERPLSQESPCLLLIKVIVKERKRHERGGREAPVWWRLEGSTGVNIERGRQTVWPRGHLLMLKPRPRKIR